MYDRGSSRSGRGRRSKRRSESGSDSDSGRGCGSGSGRGAIAGAVVDTARSGDGYRGGGGGGIGVIGIWKRANAAGVRASVRIAFDVGAAVIAASCPEARSEFARDALACVPCRLNVRDYTSTNTEKHESSKIER